MSWRAGETRAHASATRGRRKCLTSGRVFLRRGARWTAVRASALGEALATADRGPAEIAALNETIAAVYRSHRLSLRRLAASLVDDRAIAEELVQGCPCGPLSTLGVPRRQVGRAFLSSRDGGQRCSLGPAPSGHRAPPSSWCRARRLAASRLRSAARRGTPGVVAALRACPAESIQPCSSCGPPGQAVWPGGPGRFDAAGTSPSSPRRLPTTTAPWWRSFPRHRRSGASSRDDFAGAVARGELTARLPASSTPDARSWLPSMTAVVNGCGSGTPLRVRRRLSVSTSFVRWGAPR